MDVSNAVDLLFSGVVPERLSELDALWGRNAERVRLTGSTGFLLQQVWGTIQVSEIALRQIWLTGYAAEQALEAYLAVMTVVGSGGGNFDPDAWHKDLEQARADDKFDELYDKVIELGCVHDVDDIDWPLGIPKPAMGLTIKCPRRKAVFDLVCVAGAWVFAHEVRHNIYEQDQDAPDELPQEEIECDRWALTLLIDKADNYAIENGWDPATVRAKRLLGVLIAILTILVVTPRPAWGTDTHPAIADRFKMLLDAASGPLPDWFWPTAASMIAGFARKLGLVNQPISLVSGFKQLSYDLITLMKP
jgi:Peptidase U49